MLSRRLVPLLMIVGTLVLTGRLAHAQDEDGAAPDGPAAAEQAAQEAAEEWLQHVDTGAWATAWDEAAPGLRDTVSQEQWKRRAVQARSVLGPVRSRRLTRAQYRDTLRQDPDAGSFVLLRYRSVFGADLYVETILAVNTDDAWTVAGYEVAPVAAEPRRRELN